MKKKLLSIFIPAFIFSVFLFFPIFRIRADTPQEGRCYSECGVYKFYWVGDMCYDMVMQNCSTGTDGLVYKAVKFIKAAYNLAKKNQLAMIVDVADVFKAMFVCKPLIEDCIIPRLNDCKAACDYNPYLYAPNLSVGSPYSNYFHGIYYDKVAKTLTFRVVNNGRGYAWDIDAQASWGSTPNRDGVIKGGPLLFNETIPELLFWGSRQGIPPGVVGIVADFLIDESNFTSYLSGFKSDADEHYVPPAWEKTIPFNPPENELTRVIFYVDASQLIPESNELDNSYVLEIDNRPSPAKFEFEDVQVNMGQNTVTDFSVTVKIKNLGEEEGSAVLKWYEGNYKPGDTTFHEIQSTIPGLSSSNFNHDIIVDVSNGSGSCATRKQYTLIVEDPYGGKRTTHFEIPLYAGMISGSVENLDGNNVEGAAVTLSDGQTTNTNKFGNYSFGGISQLGKLTITVSHPDYTQTQTQEIEMSYSPGNNLQTYCDIPGLLHMGVNFVLQDEPVLLNIKIKDRYDNFLTGDITASNQKYSHSFHVEGEGSFENIQPGKYEFNLSILGYYAQSMSIVLTAPEQNVEFIMERLLGRPDDQGLTIHTPQLLWEKEMPKGNLTSSATYTKDGKLLVVYTSMNRQNTGKLYFIEPESGNEIRVVDTPSTLGQQQTELDASYDGRTVGFMTNPGSFGSTKVEKIVKLFNASGQEYNSTTTDEKKTTFVEVSPDGSYVYAIQLMNNSLYKFTRAEIEGREKSTAPQTYSVNQDLYFLKNNNFIGGCGKGGGQCIRSLKGEDVRKIVDLKGVSRAIDTSFDDSTIIIRSDDTINYFSPGGSWVKYLERNSSFISAAVSVGGEYTMVTNGSGGGEWTTLKVFDRGGVDVTPDFAYKDVFYVTANDKGMYFLTVRGEKLAYYKIGSYDTEYNPDELSGAEEGEYWVDDLEVYEDGEFHDTYAVPWFGVIESQMYRAKKRVTFSTNFGSITFSPDTIFTQREGKPIVLYGQAQIHATQPIEMVLLKIKVYDPNVFYDKLYAYYNNQLPENEYALVKNYHTDYTAKTKNGTILVSVQDGEVETIFNKQKIAIYEGNKLQIDEKDNYKTSKDYSKIFKYFCFGIILTLVTIVEIKYKNSNFIKKFNSAVLIIAKKTGELITKVLKLIFNLLKKLAIIMVNKIRKKKDEPENIN